MKIKKIQRYVAKKAVVRMVVVAIIVALENVAAPVVAKVAAVIL